MSIVAKFSNSYLISHSDYFKEVYKQTHVNGQVIKSFELNEKLFQIEKPFSRGNNSKSSKNGDFTFGELKENTKLVQRLFEAFRREAGSDNLIADDEHSNDTAAEKARKVYEATEKLDNYGLCLYTNVCKSLILRKHKYLFPENCRVHCMCIYDIPETLSGDQYDLIVLDPPWWNKYVRRKRKKTGHAYDMLYNSQIEEIPIESLLKENGLVVVWCTNSQQNLQDLQSKMFKKWNVKSVAKWFWLKVTTQLEPVCYFAEPPAKQPFEQILIGTSISNDSCTIPDNQLVVSVPSALHSHKPPLIEILKPFLPENPKCLEIFARYLLPNFTSWGLEAVRFQHISLYKESS